MACLASLAVASEELDWSQTAEENYERLFTLCDKNLDGMIHRDEHQHCAKEMFGTDVDAVDVWMNFSHKDLNHDNYISGDELKYVTEKSMTEPTTGTDDFGTIFNYVDGRTVDGMIDQEEF